ncbi:hypothetical protein DLM78_05050 [Leptospira stimsonii]|uniref:Uncharacterized protein n=1 Tax=Leptospira stimsonii TaxID=2202203 RepID=A0A8B3CST7_9LEPT|nr:hypothetical protein DLM78_05050 [Leptospira stimsonii]
MILKLLFFDFRSDSFDLKNAAENKQRKRFLKGINVCLFVRFQLESKEEESEKTSSALFFVVEYR